MDDIFANETNIAKILSDEKLEEIGIEVVEGFWRDKNSRSEWEQGHQEMMKLALQVAEKKDFPWDDAANVKYPLLTVSAVQFAARVDMFNGNNAVRCEVIGEDRDGSKADRAIRISKHMSWQLLKQMQEWEEDNDRMMHALPIIGAMFKKTYFCPVRERNVSELVYPMDLIFDYWAKDVETAMRKTHVLRLTDNEITERIRSGIYLDADLGKPSGMPVDWPLDEEIEKKSYYEDDDGPRRVLEQHCFWDLDGDDYAEPYVITVDLDTTQLLRIAPRFLREDVKQNDRGEIRRIEPTEYFTQFKFLPDPNGGNLGLGFGHLQGPLNEVANTLCNQLIDAGTLSNMQPGFLAKGFRARAGDFRFRPGEWKMVQTTGQMLRESVFPLPVRDPSQVLFLLFQMIVEGAEKVGSISDAMVGEAPPPNTPATSTLATLEQGLKVFKKIHRRLYGSFTKEFRKLYALNARYLAPIEYFRVLDISTQELQKVSATTSATMRNRGTMPVVPDDYRMDNDVYPSADPNVMTEMERAKKAEILIQTMPLGWPIEEVKRRFLESMKFENPDALLQPPPQPGPPPEIMIEQMRSQVKGAEIQSKMQMEQARIQLDAQRLAIDVQKTQMEMAKIEAEIRKILAEVESTGEDGTEEKTKLEVQKLMAEYQIKQAELGLKEQELLLKNKEIDSTRQTALDTDQNRGAVEKYGQLEQALAEMEARRKAPKEIRRDENGLLLGVGDMDVVRGEDGRAVAIQPKEEAA